MTAKPTYEEMEQRIKELEQAESERKRAEERNERLGHILYESLNEIYIFDAKTLRFLQVNLGARRNLGYSIEEFTTLTPLDLKPEFTPEVFAELIQPLHNGEKDKVRFETIHRRKDRSLYPVEVHLQLVAGGAPVFVAIIIDITKRKQAEEALRESEGKYRSIMESIKGGVYICSSDLRIEYMNPAMIARVGRDASGEFCHKVIYNNDEKCSWCVLDQVQQGEYVDHELTDPKNNNYYSTSNSPIHHADGSISKLTIARDITRVKKIESQLQQSQKMEAVSTLSGGIAHQFNNALYAITGNIDLLEMDFPDDENVANYAKEIKGSARRMTQLTAQLLAYARGGKYQAKTVLLNDFLKESLFTIKYSIDSTIHVDTDLPQGILNVKIDITQMQMVLSNVLSNASEAMEGEGSIRVVCRNKMITDKTVIDFPELKPGNYACLSITDDGKGMDEETRTRIFEPFFTTKFEGRGLGMAAAFGIVKNHNGWISVDSELGKGTIVKIYLPAVEAPVKKDAKPKPKTEWIKGEGTILVIDDEEPVINVSRAMLERLGYRVLEAKTGQEAINVVKNYDGKIDLAMLDILLPGIGGESIYPLLMKARPNLKVIVFTGYSIKGPAQKILDAGAEDFIQKPFSMSELSEKLKKILGNGQ